MKLLPKILLSVGCIVGLSACGNQTEDPALSPRNSVRITPQNMNTVIMNAIEIYRAHGELPIRVGDLSVAVSEGGLVIRPSSDKLTCSGDGFNDEISGVGDKSNAFAYTFDECQAEVIDPQNYNLLSGYVIMKDILGSSGVCDDFRGEFSYRDMELTKIRNGEVSYLLGQINGSYSFRHLTRDSDSDGICDFRSTAISGDSFTFELNGEQIEESLFSSTDEYDANVDTYHISLNSYINSDSLNGRYRLATLRPLVGLRNNLYPLRGKFDLIGAGVTQVTVEVLSGDYLDYQAVKLDMDINPADGKPDNATSLYISWCELVEGEACELLQEDATQVQP